MMIHHGCHYFLIFKIMLRNENSVKPTRPPPTCLWQTTTTTSFQLSISFLIKLWSITSIIPFGHVLHNSNFLSAKRLCSDSGNTINHPLISVTLPSLIVLLLSSALPHLGMLCDYQSLMIGHNSCHIYFQAENACNRYQGQGTAFYINFQQTIDKNNTDDIPL